MQLTMEDLFRNNEDEVCFFIENTRGALDTIFSTVKGILQYQIQEHYNITMYSEKMYHIPLVNML